MSLIGQSPYAIYKMDACALLNLSRGDVDLIVTDPAYACLEKHRAVGTTTRLKESKGSSNKWFEIFPDSRYPEFFDAADEAMKKNTHLYMMVAPDFEQQRMMVMPATDMGFTMWNPLVWNKQKIGMGYHWRSQYENILFFEKGKRKLNNLGWSNVIDIHPIRDGYPTEKPVELYERLILNSSNEGDLVCDPFMGSGNCGVACARTGRRFLGGDISDDSMAMAAERLQKETWR